MDIVGRRRHRSLKHPSTTLVHALAFREGVPVSADQYRTIR